ncbi:MAG: redox-regulated ATPase YchF [Acidimicrobiia bacterium]|nr:redox-regulated ATPase YchF [Acidimicrobiia bacterium]
MEHLGLVGLPDSGHDRLFAALTGLDVPGGFEKVVGVASLPDERLSALSEMSHSKKTVPAGFEVVFLPPVGAGAQPGESLGSRLLGSLRDADAVLFVLRGFDGHDPASDLDALEYELVLADLASVETRLAKQRRAVKGDKGLAAEVAALEKAAAALGDGVPVYRSDLSAQERDHLAPVFLLTNKPVLVVVNVGEAGDAGAAAGGADGTDPAAAFGPDALTVAVDLEAEIAACDPADRPELLESFGIDESVLPRLSRAAYHLLGRRTFFTTGDKETRAWTFRAGARAPECAGVIHSDLERGFIRAEVIPWDELLAIGSWAKAKEANRLRVEGKQYEVADGDVVEIRFNV